MKAFLGVLPVRTDSQKCTVGRGVQECISLGFGGMCNCSLLVVCLGYVFYLNSKFTYNLTESSLISFKFFIFQRAAVGEDVSERKLLQHTMWHDVF